MNVITSTRRIAIPTLGTSSWLMLGLVLGVGLTIHVVLPAYLSTTVLNPMGGVISVAAVGGVRRTADRTAFSLLAGGVVVYALADAIAFISTVPGLHAFVTGLFLVAYAAFAGGFAYHFAQSRRG